MFTTNYGPGEMVIRWKSKTVCRVGVALDESLSTDRRSRVAQTRVYHRLGDTLLGVCVAMHERYPFDPAKHNTIWEWLADAPYPPTNAVRVTWTRHPRAHITYDTDKTLCGQEIPDDAKYGPTHATDCAVCLERDRTWTK